MKKIMINKKAKTLNICINNFKINNISLFY